MFWDKKYSLSIFLTLCSKILLVQSQGLFVNNGFEQTAAGIYTTANAVNGWTVSSQIGFSCTSDSSWTPGSSEFSVFSP